MTEFENIQQDKEGINRSVFFIFCFCIALAFVLAYLFGVMSAPRGDLVDSDCFVRLTRTTDLYETGNWYHPAPMKTNTPYGDISHWTRPFDVLLLLGAVPLSKLIGFHEALFVWGVVITPILLALTLIALNWATRVILSKDGTFLVILLFLSQTVLLSYFQPARPDHHGLLVLLFVLLIGLVLRLSIKPFKPSVCCAAGAVAALSVWVSVESIVPVCLSLGVLALLWVFQKGDFLKKSRHFTLSLFAFSGIALLLERPFSDMKTIEFDRLSIVYVCLLGLIALFWVVASSISRQTPLLRPRPGRIVYGVVGGAFIALVMGLVFPAFYKGPMADVDPRIIPIWLSKINEIQSLISSAEFLSTSLQVIGSAVVSFLFLLCLLRRSEKQAHRNGWIYLSVSAAAFVLIAILQVRWAVYAQTILSIILAELLYRVLQWRRDQGNKLIRALRNGLVTLVFAFGFLYTGILVKTFVKGDQPHKKSREVSLIPMCEYLSERDRPLRILTHLNYAGEILYRTPHEVLGSNYHRNGPGIMDSYAIMTAQTDARAFELIRQRRLDIILIRPDSKEKFYNAAPDGDSTFYRRLQADSFPDGLRKVQLPKNLATDFIMFEVTRNSSPKSQAFMAFYSTR